MTEQRPFSRRAFFPVLTGAISFAFDAHAQGARPFPQWVESFRARAISARHFGRDLHARDGQPQARHRRSSTAIRNQPEFKEQLWQYLNRRVSDWRITDRQGEG